MFTFKITDPVSFYKQLGGNVPDVYERDTIVPTLKQEFVGGLNRALGALSDLSIRPYALPQHVDELCDSMNKVLNDKWSRRGIEVFSIALNSVSMPEEDQKMLKEIQKAAAYATPGMAAAQMARAQADAMVTAAGNANGAMNGFMGMGMAQGAGGINAANLFAMQQQQPQQPQMQQPQQAPQGGWTCACGTQNTGKFCMNCGQQKPEPQGSWTCSCGTQNTGKFCMNCGQQKPQAGGACPECGAKYEGPTPKFCPQCGHKF
jgi:membrane protease subunit (stomatin/prohibitin family)